MFRKIKLINYILLVFFISYGNNCRPASLFVGNEKMVEESLQALAVELNLAEKLDGLDKKIADADEKKLSPEIKRALLKEKEKINKELLNEALLRAETDAAKSLKLLYSCNISRDLERAGRAAVFNQERQEKADKAILESLRKNEKEKAKKKQKEKRKKLNKDLHEAIRAGNIDKTKKLVAAGANKNAQDKNNNTPLHGAVDKENIAIITWLLEIGADFKLQNLSNQTPFELAKVKGNKAIVELLGKYSNQEEIQKETGSKEVSEESKQNEIGQKEQEEEMQFPKPRPAPAVSEPEFEESENKEENDAVEPQDFEILLNEDELLKDLHNLIFCDTVDFDAIKKIALTGIDINKKVNGTTALHQAAYSGNVELVKLYTEHNANCNIADDYLGWTAFHYAASNGKRDAGDCTEAQLKEYAVIVKAMMDNPTTRDIPTQDKDELDVFIVALLHGNIETINILENFYGVGKKYKNKATILHYAALNDNPEVIGFLVTKGAKINAKDNSNETPLHWASRQGNLSVIHKLIELGADKTIENIDGETPPNLYHRYHS